MCRSRKLASKLILADSLMFKSNVFHRSTSLNKCRENFIDVQFNRVLPKFKIDQPFTANNYSVLRQQLIELPIEERMVTDHRKIMFIHFTYCTTMRSFPSRFHTLWHRYFEQSPINEVTPILGTRNVENLQRRLIHIRTPSLCR